MAAFDVKRLPLKAVDAAKGASVSQDMNSNSSDEFRSPAKKGCHCSPNKWAFKKRWTKRYTDWYN